MQRKSTGKASQVFHCAIQTAGINFGKVCQSSIGLLNQSVGGRLDSVHIHLPCLIVPFAALEPRFEQVFVEGISPSAETDALLTPPAKFRQKVVGI